MLSKEEVKRITMRELNLKEENFFSDSDWEIIYGWLITDDANVDALDTEEHLVEFYRKNNKESA